MPGGRPSLYSEELAEEICRRIAGGRSLRSVCRDADMPDGATVCRWLAKEEHARFRDHYAHARELQADALFDEALEIADNGTNDWMLHNDPDNPGYRLNGEHVQRSRLRVDTRKWAAAKLAPKKYGDKIEQTLQGPGGSPLVVEIVRFSDHPIVWERS